MFSSIRFVKSFPFRGIVRGLMIVVLTLFPSLVSAGEDLCSKTGIYIMNQTHRRIWYTRNGGPCTIWQRGHILILKPEDTLIIYRDMICKTEYCLESPTYDVYKSIDVNQNCKVRIYPHCILSDR